MSNNAQVLITQARIDQVDQVCNKFISNFEKPFSAEYTPEQFTSVFHRDIQWQDHAFLVRRVGHEAVIGLQKAWLHCNQPFKADIKAITPTAEGAIIEQVWIGRCANDIVRPDGLVAVKASGKDYKCHVCMVMKISEDGLIEKIDEYYNRRWDDGVSDASYTVMKGDSLKARA